MANRKTILKGKSKGGATAEHYKAGSHDIVKIGDLRVLVKEDDGWWFAQGVEIDYEAQGKSLDEVKEKFARGLVATAHAYLEEFGSIEKFLRPAPPDILRELANASGKGLLISTTSKHELEEPIKETLPFSGINFFERLREPVMASA